MCDVVFLYPCNENVIRLVFILIHPIHSYINTNTHLPLVALGIHKKKINKKYFPPRSTHVMTDKLHRAYMNTSILQSLRP